MGSDSPFVADGETWGFPIMTKPQKASPRPMDIHEDLDEYFRVLHEDPYGLENDSYDWNGEDRFVAVTGSVYLLIAGGMFLASSEG